MTAEVVAVHRNAEHAFSKDSQPEITVLEGLGVDGDAHFGRTVQHLSRMKADPSQPNLRQVHLIHTELFETLADAGFAVKPGELGENVSTRGIDLLGLPRDARLNIGTAVLTITGLRNPCKQINAFQPGLMKQLIRSDISGRTERLSGIMSVVTVSGIIRPGDAITVELPKGTHSPLTPV